jgi:hypothetical protein
VGHCGRDPDRVDHLRHDPAVSRRRRWDDYDHALHDSPVVDTHPVIDNDSAADDHTPATATAVLNSRTRGVTG